MAAESHCTVEDDLIALSPEDMLIIEVASFVEVIDFSEFRRPRNAANILRVLHGLAALLVNRAGMVVITVINVVRLAITVDYSAVLHLIEDVIIEYSREFRLQRDKPG